MRSIKPIINKAMDAFVFEYNKYSGLTHAMREIAINPEMSFDDLYTVMKYIDNDLRIDYYNIL